MTETAKPAVIQSRRPWISINLPDNRGWVALGLFALTWRIFEMVREKPQLTENQGFMFLSQAIIVSGLIGGVVAFLYTASKSGADNREITAQALAKIPDHAPADAGK
jgi:hypothetical protein